MTPELAKRIAFTLGALLVYRLGTYIPVPGIDPQALGQILNDHRGALTLRRLSLFSLGLIALFLRSHHHPVAVADLVSLQCARKAR